ncbi:3-coathanger stack domain-containing protein [Lacihabitans soyangensis]|uniref:Ig-like domain-containing protein n=1 Tax=Lacihabitans soyangensis TaxID=869394 RepID=A0AAE3H9B6_9BACT|nr:3-coathanger stack domain-containing protein [Lacihabitans soyangensis]MCP9766050.1 hypothetical protein [Lacihabitans soyangensis]
MKKLLLFFGIVLAKIGWGQSITASGFENPPPTFLNPNGLYTKGSVVNGKNSYSRSIGYNANGCNCSGIMYIEWNATNLRWQFRFNASQSLCNFCPFASGTYFTNTADIGMSPPCTGWSSGSSLTGDCNSINPPDPPVISSSATAVCAGTSVNLTATGCSNTVNWSDGGIGATRNNVIFNASLTLTATCNNGLTSGNSNSISITVNPKPNLIITNPAAVSPPNTVDITLSTLTAGSTLNGATLSYHSDAAGNVTLTNPPPSAINISGTYYIKALTTTGCADIKPVLVVINDCGTPVVLQSPIDDYSSGTTLKKTNETILANNKITGNANVVYRSNKSVTLDPGSLGNPGFKAEAGVVFKAEIGGCN